MALRQIPIISSVSENGILRYSINHDIGSLFATCSIEMLTTNALLIDDELTLENEVFNIISSRKRPHRRGKPRTVQLEGRSKAGIFETTTIDNTLQYRSNIGGGEDKILYDEFDSPSKSLLFENGVFKGTITKAKKCGCLGENGWTAHGIMKDMIKYTEIAAVEIACMDYNILLAQFEAGDSVISAANKLFGMFNPFIYAQAQVGFDSEGEPSKPTLFIIPTSDPQDYDWPSGSKIDQSVEESKLDDITKMVIIIGGSEIDDSVPNPCEPNCPEQDIKAIIADWKDESETSLVDMDDFIDKTAYDRVED